MAEPRDGSPSESASYVISACRESDVKFVRLWFTDIVGALKSFQITVGELEKALAEGMGFDGSSIEGFARIDESDMLARPDPTTFQLVPWRPREQGVARMFCDIYRPDGEPFEGDPRQVLRRQLERAKALGYTFYVSPELEYFYFRDSEGAEPLDRGGYFDQITDAGTDLRRDTVLTLNTMGIEVESSHHEVAPSQHEIALRYTDALTMADSAMTYRAVVKEIAATNGVYASFMPKPLAEENGSGMHVHQSLFKGERNAFFDAGDEYHLSALAKGYVAGLLEHARAIHARHEPVGEQLQAAAARLRGARVPELGAPQPQRPRAHSRVLTRRRGAHAHRVPFARSRLQPLPRVRGDAGGGPRRHRMRTGVAAPGRGKRLRNVRGGALGPRDCDPACESAAGDRSGGGLHGRA